MTIKYSPDALTVKLSSAIYSPLIAWREKYNFNRRFIAVNGETKERKTRKTLCLYAVSDTSNKSPLTDTAAAYVMHAASKMAYTAIKSVYTAQCSPFMLDLMTQATAAIHRDNINAMRTDISHDENGAPLPYVEYIPHNKKKVFGYFMKVPTYYTQELTETGKKVIALKDISTNDFDDCAQIAALEILKYCNNGVIQSFADIWQIRTFVYRAVNRYIMYNRKSIDENKAFQDYCVFRQEDGSEIVYTGKKIEKRLACVSVDDIKDVVKSSIDESNNRRINKNNLKTVVELSDNYSNIEIAKIMSIDEKQVRRYKKYIMQLATSPDTMALLHDIV